MKKYHSLEAIAALIVFTFPQLAMAEELTVTINAISSEGVGEEIGTIQLKDTDRGLLLTPNLSQLNGGIHGFHIHENPDCNPGEKDGKLAAGIAAGGHYDPENTEKHQGPYSETGHLGDLPRLKVKQDGTATRPVVAPRLKIADIRNHAIMIHEHGDNYGDEPEPLGGGGGRIACGIIP
jgi:Cu-Zn family superoxide dismutase